MSSLSLAMQSQPCTLSMKDVPATLYALLQTWHQYHTQGWTVSTLLLQLWRPSTSAWARPLFSFMNSCCWFFHFRSSPLSPLVLNNKRTESYLLCVWLCSHLKKKKNSKKLTLSSGKMGLPVSLLVIYLSIWYSVWSIIDSIENWQMNSSITIKKICEYYWPWQTREYFNLFCFFSFLFQKKKITVNSQGYVSFWCAAKWFSYIYYIILFHYS